MAPDNIDLEAIQEDYAKCAADPWYFISHHVHISDPNKGDIPFEAWVHLRDLLSMVMANDRVIILKARQIGITWLFAGLALWYCLFRPNSQVLVLSIGQLEATAFKKRCR